MSEPVKLPLWKNCLEAMREKGFTYGASWPVNFFESQLRTKADSTQFQFEMLQLKCAMEEEDGYYLRSEENGALWSIPAAADHEDVARSFESKMKRYAVRSVALRNSTLTNPDAVLSDAERTRMEAALERASIRMVLMARQKQICRLVFEKKPKLLQK